MEGKLRVIEQSLATAPADEIHPRTLKDTDNAFDELLRDGMTIEF